MTDFLPVFFPIALCIFVKQAWHIAVYLFVVCFNLYSWMLSFLLFLSLGEVLVMPACQYKFPAVIKLIILSWQEATKPTI